MKSDSGVTLIEMAVAIAILGIVLMINANFMGKIGENSTKSRIYGTQKILASVVKNAIQSPSTISFSISRSSKNRTLARCLLSMGTKIDLHKMCYGLRKKDGGNIPQHEIILFRQSDTLGVMADEISGIYYDINGNPCKKGSKNCIFYVDTRFYIRCIDIREQISDLKKNRDSLINYDSDRIKIIDTEISRLESLNQCGNGIDQLFISYQVRQISPSNPNKILRVIPKTQDYAILSSKNILGANRNNKCGSGAPNLIDSENLQKGSLRNSFQEGFYASLVGYHDNGSPICKCIYPFIEIPNPKKVDHSIDSDVPLCRLMTDQELSCDPNSKDSYLRGINDRSEAKEVFCVDEESAFTCEPRNPHIGCPAGSWVNSYLSQTCDFECQYIPNKERICSFIWSSGMYINDGSDNLAITGFSCSTLSLECCFPTRYKDSWYNEN